jgi:hypothetical protein
MTFKLLVKRIEKNRFVKLIAVLAVVLGALITIGTFFSNISTFFYDNLLMSKNISDKINEL